LVHEGRRGILKINLLLYPYNFKFQDIRYFSYLKSFKSPLPPLQSPNLPNIGGDKKLNKEGFCSPPLFEIEKISLS